MRVRVVTFGQITAFLIVFWLGLPISSNATVFWEESFENHLTPNWDTSACGGSPQDGCNPRISTTIVHSGTRSLVADYTCTTQSSGIGCGAYFDRTFPASGDVWFRYYSYTVPGFQYWPTNMAKRFSLRPTSGYANMWIAHWYGTRNEGYSMEYYPPSPPYAPCQANNQECILGATSSAAPLGDGQWYCVEGHLKANTVGQADGLYEMWVNGTQTVSLPNRGDFITTVQWNTFRFYVQNSVGTMYYDDVAVGNTRIGCGVGQLPASTDVTVPSPPGGLRVQ